MKYDPSKHEEGTPASVRYAKSMTPGENKKKEKKMKDFHEYRQEVAEAGRFGEPKFKYAVYDKDGKHHGSSNDRDGAHKMAKTSGGRVHQLATPTTHAKIPKTRSEAYETVTEDDMDGHSVKGGHKLPVSKGAGMTKKGVEKYKRDNPGSKLSTAVTTPPSKLKAGSKAAGRRKSFCARSRSWDGERGKAARKRWNC